MVVEFKFRVIVQDREEADQIMEEFREIVRKHDAAMGGRWEEVLPSIPESYIPFNEDHDDFDIDENQYDEDGEE